MDRIDALRLLLEVAEEGNFSAVARRRALATSTVTLAINQLESEFCARLIQRSTRKLVFTHEGETLLADARRIVSEWDASLSGLSQNGPLTGPIRVTTTNDFGRSRLRKLLDEFQSHHSGIHISLILGDQTVDLIDGHFDLALRNGPLPDSNLLARLLLRGERLVCASPRYWARAGKPVHPTELTHHNCMILARPGAPLAVWPFKDRDRAFTIKVTGDRQASDGGVLREWAIDGLGIIIKNRWDIAPELEQGTLATALDDYVAGTTNMYAVYPSGQPSRRVLALVDFLAEALASPAERDAISASSRPL